MEKKSSEPGTHPNTQSWGEWPSRRHGWVACFSFPSGDCQLQVRWVEGQVGRLTEPSLTPMPSCFTAFLLRRLREHIQKFQESSTLHPGLGLGHGPGAVPKQGWLEQPLDPFNASDRRTFLQVRSTALSVSQLTLHLVCVPSCNPSSLLSTLPCTPAILELER